MSPYLSFRGDAAAAFAFYQSVFGGELSSNTFGEFGAPDAPADQIMHAALEVAGFTLMPPLAMKAPAYLGATQFRSQLVWTACPHPEAAHYRWARHGTQ